MGAPKVERRALFGGVVATPERWFKHASITCGAVAKAGHAARGGAVKVVKRPGPHGHTKLTL
jgi:hypothetical protein